MKRKAIIKKYLKANGFYLMQRDLIIDGLKSSTDISIVIPAYNEQLCLPRLFRSLDHQSYQNFEVIAVDNGSTDRTKEVVSLWQRRVNYPLYLVTKFKKGAANARKRGMDEVLLRVAARGNDFPFHLIVTTDADATPAYNWLEKMRLKAKNYRSVALAGTHQADPEVDLAIEEKLSIKNYFNLIPSIIESFSRKNIGVIKMSGPNAAFEIEAYAAGDGIRQEYDEGTGLVKLNEVNSLGKRIKQCVYPVIPMEVRVTTSKRRQLKEILEGGDSYFPGGFLERDRFNVVREDERELLKSALESIDKNAWLKYRQKIITIVLNNFILSSFVKGEVNPRTAKLNTQINKLISSFTTPEVLVASDLLTLIIKQFARVTT